MGDEHAGPQHCIATCRPPQNCSDMLAVAPCISKDQVHATPFRQGSCTRMARKGSVPQPPARVELYRFCQFHTRILVRRW